MNKSQFIKLVPFVAVGLGINSAVFPVQVGAQVKAGTAISGQGSSFVANFIDSCRAAANKEFSMNVSYQATGSGAGRNSFIEGTNDFAASDVAFSAEEIGKLKGKKFAYVPIAAGGIAVVYNVPGVTQLALTSDVLAGIFTGKILKWNDAKIAAINKGKKLPSKVIKVIVRSDSSGTSNVFSSYLSQASKSSWTAGATSTFPVPANGIAQKGSDGVANYLSGAQGKFSITYSEVSFAKKRKLAMAQIQNAAGKLVMPTAKAVTAALGEAKAVSDGTLTPNFVGKDPASYPISTLSYAIAPLSLEKEKAIALKTFLNYAVNKCQSGADALGYAPLPGGAITLATMAIAKIDTGTAIVPIPK